MDRWTERFTSDGEKAIAIHDGSDFPDVCFEGEREYDVMNALAEYEDLEEQGLLVRLPCKVGTEVFCYFPGDSHYTKCQIKKIEICQSIFGNICYFAESVAQRGRCCRYYNNEFGKFLFLTREEAEKKLEEMRENG
jgi:hypothetical protein